MALHSKNIKFWSKFLKLKFIFYLELPSYRLNVKDSYVLLALLLWMKFYNTLTVFVCSFAQLYFSTIMSLQVNKKIDVLTLVLFVLSSTICLHCIYSPTPACVCPKTNAFLVSQRWQADWSTPPKFHQTLASPKYLEKH